ncbi:FkbM family methyltransferase [Campylobacter novaezeelandiae]|uniref:FkbM family methyltransferase n=1 Tax=Campylobacter novaezeelandiae TaxID=2267891 RepID=A0A4Q9JU28_9BACT|nr:FkbM family methyltransferase [Campylobacter novaezeelandiae]QWU80252.1 methyltransferase, FkbM family [Campylobacter novaezeelandiae]TBR79324.1 FkbM family methyltransferase [Campylobacter novaezeelandiae]TBR80310.1 FkbM family methyltransferase [Campylobacter novaezeelandiae]
MKRPLPFILAATNNATMIVNHLDRHDTSKGSYGVGFQFLNYCSFDPEEIDFCLELLKLRRKYHKGDVFAIDCGANIGAHTIKWAIQMHEWGGVLAFEAQERLFYALAGNIAINNCFNAKAIHACLGNPQKNQKELEILVPDYTQKASFGSLELKSNNEFIGQIPQKKEKVPYLKLDNFDFKKIDFIKIDVEGMEQEVLLGCLNHIKNFKPVLQIEIIKSNPQDIIHMLNNLGYKIFQFGINILAIYKADPIINHLKINPRA